MFFQSYDVKCTATFFSVHSVFWRNTGDLPLLSAMARVCVCVQVLAACHWNWNSSLVPHYRWPDTEWKEEPAEPISDEQDLFLYMTVTNSCEWDSWKTFFL